VGKSLERAISEIREIEKESANLAWKLGRKLRVIHDGQEWLEVASSWTEFARGWLRMSPQWTTELMRVSDRFTAAQVARHGVSKLKLVDRVPESHAPALLAMLDAGATREALVEYIDTIGMKDARTPRTSRWREATAAFSRLLPEERSAFAEWVEARVGG